MSKHLSQLIHVGYLAEEQFVRAGRSRLVLSLTTHGHAAYAAHRKALKDILTDDDNITSPMAP